MLIKIQKKLADTSNYSKGRSKPIQYIVIHYTANDGDTARGNCVYFSSPNRNASAHYFVDENEIWQSVEDENTAWHCGTKREYKHKFCRNENSIGIEMCSRKDSQGNSYIKDEVFINTILLVKDLIKKYNISPENIIRHYDVTGKNCPAPMINNTKLWQNFKELLMEEDMEILKRVYKYKNNSKEFEVINVNNNYFVKVRDLAELLDKTIEFDENTKTTIIQDK